MPVTTEQRAWVGRVLFGAAEHPGAPAGSVASASAAAPALDLVIDAASRTSALSFKGLAVLLNTVHGRVTGTADTTALSKLAALGANETGMSDNGGGSGAGAWPISFSDLARTLSGVHASALADVDATALSKIAQVAAQDAPGSADAAAVPGKDFSFLATEFNGTFADIIAAVDVTTLSRLASVEGT
jgi:hypothetical protein